MYSFTTPLVHDELPPPPQSGAPRPPPDLGLLDRCRRLYMAALLKPDKGMGSGQWIRFCRDAGVLDLPGFLKADLEIMHAKLCSQQLWSPDQPAQKLMRSATFARALIAIAAKAFPDDAVAEGLAALLAHVAAHTAADDEAAD